MIWHLSPENLSLHAHSKVLDIAVQVPPNRHGPDIHKSKIPSCITTSFVYWLLLLDYLFLQICGTQMQVRQRITIFLGIDHYILLSMFISVLRCTAQKRLYLLKCMLTSLKNVVLIAVKFFTPVSLEVCMTGAVDVISIVYQVTCSSVLAGVWVTPVCLKEKDQFQFEGKSRESIVYIWWRVYVR